MEMEKVETQQQTAAPNGAADAGDLQASNQEPMEESQDMGELLDMFEESLKSFQVGEFVEGQVVSVDKEYVMVDVGYKSEAQIPIREFLGDDGEVVVSPGDNVNLLVERFDMEDGELRLSYARALRQKTWEEIQNAFEEEAPVKGTIVAKVKGGATFLVGKRPGAVKAFLPFSQIDVRPVNIDNIIGQEMECLILKCNRKRENIVVSRRVILEKELEQRRAETLSSLEEGQVREGVVKNVTDYGAFVDLGGIDGLLHVTDMSWGRVEHPSKVCNVGDTIQVKVLSFDPEKGKVSLGIKQLTEDPWLRAAEKYPVGDKVTGKVVSITGYGAFVELEEGVEGLIHISEMSWTKKIKHPSQVVAVGDTVEAVVLGVDVDARRISLGLKQVEPNPWEVVKEKYPEGTVIEGSVKNITDFGLFIGIEEGIDGLVHISDLSWNKRIKHPGELYKKGDTLQAVVLNVDVEKQRFSLGVKQLTPDPWDSVPERYPVGSTVSGKITNVTDFGVFVELEDGVEGLIHVSELGPGKIKTPVGQYEVGQEIQAKVINLAPLERRIGLSVKKISEDEEQFYFKEYSSTGKQGGTTLGSLLQEEILQKVKAREE